MEAKPTSPRRETDEGGRDHNTKTRKEMDYLGLFFEIIFLVAGIYLYLFSRGMVAPKDPKVRANAEKFRDANAGWMRILSLLLVAIMTVNIVIHVMQIFENA